MSKRSPNQVGPPGAFISRAIEGMAASLILLLWVGVITAVVLVENSDDTTESLQNVVHAIAEESNAVTNRYLGAGETAGEMAAIVLTESGGDITSQLVERTVQNLVATNVHIDGVFIGRPNGDFYYATRSVTDSPGGLRTTSIQTLDDVRTVVETQTDADFATVSTAVVEDSYDPRVRPWYIEAIAFGRGWTELYQFSLSQQPGVTRYQAVHDRSGELLGVVGVHVQLHELNRFLGGRLPSEHGEVVILDDAGLIVAGVPGRSIGETSRQALAEHVFDEESRTISLAELMIADERQVAGLSRVGSDKHWTLAVSAPDRDFFIGLGAFSERIRLFMPLLGIVLTLLTIAIALLTKRRIRRLQRNATTDPLTGLLNRSEVRRRLGDRLEDGSGVHVVAVAIDLDNFGRFNDEMGHETGDLVLVGLADRLTKAVAPTGFIGRIGGDELLLVLNVGPDDDPAEKARAIASTVTSEPITVAGSAIELRLSGGIAVCEPSQRKGLETVLREADLALLAAKRAKPDLVLFDEEMMFPSLRDAARAADLSAAVERGEFEFNFQPEVELATGRVVGAEALMRRRASDGTLLAADSFIADMERLGIVDLMVSELVRAATALGDAIADPAFTLRINLAASQLRNKQTMDMIAEAHRRSPVSWCVEITERTLVETTDVSRAWLENLVAEGVHLALDDFGTGYSSLGELAKLPITTIKIDGAFVKPLTTESAPTSLASVITDIADRLSLHLVAEGIERQEQRQALELIGCRFGQGFLFGRAVPLDEFVANYAQRSGMDQSPLAQPSP